MAKKSEIIIFQNKEGAIEFRGDFQRDTLWANQFQISDLFGIDRTVVTKHIRNIFKNNEIDIKSNVQKMHIANSDRPITLYSLDVILAVGYRTNSKIAISFRKWATKVLRQHILEGYTINKKRVLKNYHAFLHSVENIKNLLPPKELVKAEDVLELITMFSSTWFSLDAYDKNLLPSKGATKKQVNITAGQLVNALSELKSVLLNKSEASDLFALERNSGDFAGIVGNVFQSFANSDLYPTIEEKAAHLLYFVVKNHPFVDGNKRSGAYAFIWFLKHTKRLDLIKMSPQALTVLTLLVAESNPLDKDQIVGLILQLLNAEKT